MPADSPSKVTAAHLRKNAYLYVRQSTIKQVLNNTESALRQYDLKSRAIALGWSAEQVIVIDIDQGQSGASAADREGFQRLVADVGMGRAGIVLGLECSRLARNNADWHRLLEICGLAGTLICDEDGLYDPTDFNDRMLLGMKGQLSEALSRRLDKASSGYPFNRRTIWASLSASSVTVGHELRPGYARVVAPAVVPHLAAGHDGLAGAVGSPSVRVWRQAGDSGSGRAPLRAGGCGRTPSLGCVSDDG